MMLFVSCRLACPESILNFCVGVLHAGFMSLTEVPGARGGIVVKALRYKPAGRGFDSRWCHWNFSVT